MTLSRRPRSLVRKGLRSRRAQVDLPKAAAGVNYDERKEKLGVVRLKNQVRGATDSLSLNG